MPTKPSTQSRLGVADHNTAPLALWLMYVPALVLTLLRPNVGAVASCLEQFSARLPRWMRGAPEAADPSLTSRSREESLSEAAR